MQHYLRLSISFLSIFLTSLSLYSQTLAPFQPEQDCINAIPVCQNIYVQGNSYTGAGLDSTEIGFTSCLLTQERNDVWYIFTVQISGNLCFTITPNDPTDDYDWAVYDLTTSSCNDIRSTPELEVSCNYSHNIGCNGLTGPNNSTTCVRQNEACIPVTAGETYVVNVSNFSDTNFGYTLDFSSSTAVIFDNVPPEMIVANANCSNVSVEFSEGIVCSTVQASDFAVNGPDSINYIVASVSSENCDIGGSFDNQFNLIISPPILVPGTYTIELVGEVQDNCGNIGILGGINVDIAVNPLNVFASLDTICPGEQTQLTTSVDPGAAIGYLWLPDSTFIPSPIVSPAQTTTYIVGVTDTAGCLYTGAKTIVVKPLPVANFSISDSMICPEENIIVTYNGTATASSVFDWGFNGATIVSGSGPGPYELNWPNSGVQTVSLQMEENGCVGSQMAENLEVVVPPTADFSIPEGVCHFSSAEILYTGNAASDADFSWNFDGGIADSVNGPGPHAISWELAGMKELSLTVTENGCVSNLQVENLEVFELPIVSIAPIDAQCLSGNEFSFFYDGPSNILEFQWDFGDNNGNNLSTPKHSYLTDGIKIAYLEVKDVNQCRNRDSIQLEVFPQPQAQFAFENVCQSDSLLLENLSTAPPNRQLVTFIWTFGNGQGAYQERPQPVYSSPGNYDIQLVVGTNEGCMDTVSQMTTIYPLPKAQFFTQNVCAEDLATFTNASSIRDDIANDFIDSWTWFFGDGQKATDVEEPTHVYTESGDFTVQLEVISDKGCRQTISKGIEIYPLPDAPIVEDQNVCFGEVSVLKALPPMASQVEWFEDMQALTPFHRGPSYLSPPVTFAQSFFVESVSVQGCRSERRSIQLGLYNEGQGFIQRNDSVLEIPSAIASFQLGGSILGAKYRWDFGDGSTSVAEQAAHEYQYPGKYTINLSVIDINGCEYELTSQIEVKKIVFIHMPTGFSPNGDGYNDELFIGHKLLRQFQLKVFNRQGRLVYETLNPDFRWNGKSLSGQDLQEGVYVYAIRAVDITGVFIEDVGTVTVLR